MRKLVLKEKARWYIAKCFEKFERLDEYDNYQKAIEAIEREANEIKSAQGNLYCIRYIKGNEWELEDGPKWNNHLVGVSRNGDEIAVQSWAFEKVDE